MARGARYSNLASGLLQIGRRLTSFRLAYYDFRQPNISIDSFRALTIFIRKRPA